MTLDDYQTAAARTVNQSLDAHGRLMDAAAGLSEEAGEVLAHVRKHLFQNRRLDRERVAEELGDALWCLAAVAREAGLSLGDVAAGNLRKTAERGPPEG
jgi:NTP pyrophosphatase (non-canonical NTP hydrolase)